jgi:hypothetical protein
MAVEENFFQRRVSFCLRVHAEQTEKKRKVPQKSNESKETKDKTENRKQNFFDKKF